MPADRDPFEMMDLEFRSPVEPGPEPLQTVAELGVFADFQPQVPDAWRGSDYLFLANIHPTLQAHVLEAVTGPRLVVLDTMNLWIESTRDELLAILPRVDLLLVNDSEARLLSGERSLASLNETAHLRALSIPGQ